MRGGIPRTTGGGTRRRGVARPAAFMSHTYTIAPEGMGAEAFLI